MTMILTTKIKHYPSNDVGRDFIVGDMHGHYGEFIFLLKKVKFEPSMDRVFSVGDLCDRGPQSMDCLELMGQPWFYAVIGNHEKNLLGYLDSIFMGFGNPENNAAYCKDAGSWINEELNYHSVLSERLFNVYRLLLDLPNIIVVGEKEKRYHIVHGELIAKHLMTDEAIDNNFEMLSQEERISLSNNTSHGRRIHRRHLNLEELPEMNKGLSKTFCGHSIVLSPLLALSHCFIDTGCFTENGYLSLIEINGEELTHHGFKDKTDKK